MAVELSTGGALTAGFVARGYQEYGGEGRDDDRHAVAEIERIKARV